MKEPNLIKANQKHKDLDNRSYLLGYYDKEPTPPSYYETIVNSKIWNEWREHQEKTLEFDIVESIECGYLSDKHWEAFIRWIESRPMQENATSMQNLIKEMKIEWLNTLSVLSANANIEQDINKIRYWITEIINKLKEI